jgi:hypothetical protein
MFLTRPADPMRLRGLRRQIVSWKPGQLATIWVAGLGLIAAAVVYYFETPTENSRIADSFERQIAEWNDYESAQRSRADTASWRLRLIAELERRGVVSASFASQKRVAQIAIDGAASTSDIAIRANYVLQMASLAARAQRTTQGDLALSAAGTTFVILLALAWIWFGRERPLSSTLTSDAPNANAELAKVPWRSSGQPAKTPLRSPSSSARCGGWVN